MNIRFKLILAGVLPAMTEDYEEQYIDFAKKHSDIMATDYVIHEHRKTLVLYNKNHCRSYIFIDDAIDQIIKLSFSKKIFC
jgi:hypothetical protein